MVQAARRTPSSPTYGGALDIMHDHFPQSLHEPHEQTAG